MSTLSGSMVQTFLQCPRKYKYSFVEKRQPRDRDQALSFGAAWHESRAARWKRQPYSFKVDLAGKIRSHEVALLDVFDTTYTALYGVPTAKPLLVEERCEVVIGGVTLSVKFDALVEGTDGRKLLYEYKTTSSDISPEAHYWERLTLDTQVSLYWLAAKALGHEIHGVVYDVIRKPLLRKGRTETPEDFTGRCLDAISNETDKYFGRQVIKRTQSQLDAAVEDLTGVSSLVQLGKYPRATRSCLDWNRVCEYHAVCSGDATLTDNNMFEDSTYE